MHLMELRGSPTRQIVRGGEMKLQIELKVFDNRVASIVPLSPSDYRETLKRCAFASLGSSAKNMVNIYVYSKK